MFQPLHQAPRKWGICQNYINNVTVKGLHVGQCVERTIEVLDIQQRKQLANNRCNMLQLPQWSKATETPYNQNLRWCACVLMHNTRTLHHHGIVVVWNIKTTQLEYNRKQISEFLTWNSSNLILSFSPLFNSSSHSVILSMSLALHFLIFLILSIHFNHFFQLHRISSGFHPLSVALLISPTFLRRIYRIHRIYRVEIFSFIFHPFSFLLFVFLMGLSSCSSLAKTTTNSCRTGPVDSLS